MWCEGVYISSQHNHITWCRWRSKSWLHTLTASHASWIRCLIASSRRTWPCGPKHPHPHNSEMSAWRCSSAWWVLLYQQATCWLWDSFEFPICMNYKHIKRSCPLLTRVTRTWLPWSLCFTGHLYYVSDSPIAAYIAAVNLLCVHCVWALCNHNVDMRMCITAECCGTAQLDATGAV